MCSLPTMFMVSDDKNIIQLNNNMKPFGMAKEQYGFSEEAGKPSGYSHPKRQKLSIDKVCGAKQTIKIIVMLKNRNMHP